jgi:uncharacterized protein DUF6378
MQNKETVLDEAKRLVYGDRQKDYGSPLTNHTHTAALFSAYLGIPITPEQVCYLNILQKVSRSINGFKRDTITDIAGYAGNLEMIQNEREENK